MQLRCIVGILFSKALTFHRYNKPFHIGSFMYTAILEPLIYHPMTVWWGIRGNIDYFRGGPHGVHRREKILQGRKNESV